MLFYTKTIGLSLLLKTISRRGRIVVYSASNPTGAIRALTGEAELMSTIKNENLKKVKLQGLGGPG